MATAVLSILFVIAQVGLFLVFTLTLITRIINITGLNHCSSLLWSVWLSVLDVHLCALNSKTKTTKKLEFCEPGVTVAIMCPDLEYEFLF